MKDLNRIILIGRLGADPIQRETKSGISVVHFPVATSRRIKIQSGEVEAELGSATPYKEAELGTEPPYGIAETDTSPGSDLSPSLDTLLESASPISRARRPSRNLIDFFEETVWHRVVAWGRQGESCARHLRKGQSVYVEGSLRSRKYVGKDNVQRLAFEVHAESVGFLGASNRRHSNGEDPEEGRQFAI